MGLKEGIHPNYTETKVTCSCGETFNTRSTKSVLKVEICSKCHPFYSGKQKLLDSQGRVQRFEKRYNLKKVSNSSDEPQSEETSS